MEIPVVLPILLDGATATNLISAGLTFDRSIEQWILDNPKKLIDLQKSFVESGSQIIYAPTFSANRIKLSSVGLEKYVSDINKQLVSLSKEAAEGKALVAGNLSPAMNSIEEVDDIAFHELVDIYREQATALAEAGVDLFAIETMMSIKEIRAAIFGCRKLGIPIILSITTDENGDTPYGDSALSILISVKDLGIFAFGLNCGCGIQGMLSTINELSRFCSIPLFIKPSAGMPNIVLPDVYELSPQVMADSLKPFFNLGVKIIGGCCGTTPEHISEMKKALDSFDFSKVQIEVEDTSLVLANGRETFFLSADNLEFSEPLPCTVDMVDELLELSSSNLDVITIDVLSADDAYQFSQNAHMASLPIMFRSESEIALKAALYLYQGKAMIDSNTTIDEEVLNKIAKKYGAIIY